MSVLLEASAAAAAGADAIAAITADGGTLVVFAPDGAERLRVALPAPASTPDPGSDGGTDDRSLRLGVGDDGDLLVWGAGRPTLWLDAGGRQRAAFPAGDRAALLGRGALWRIVRQGRSEVLHRHRRAANGVVHDVMPLHVGRPASVDLQRASADGAWAYAGARASGPLGGRGAMLLTHAEWDLPPALGAGSRSLPVQMAVVGETVFTTEPRGLTRDGVRVAAGRWWLAPGPAGVAAVGPDGAVVLHADGPPEPLVVEGMSAGDDGMPRPVRHSGGLLWWGGCAWDAAGAPVCGLSSDEEGRPLWCDGHTVVLRRGDGALVRRDLTVEERIEPLD